MNTASPLRYPGGKSSMVDLLSKIRRLNGLGNLDFAEPFAGGAGAALKLLYLEQATNIYINDADTAVHDFWWSVVKQPKKFLSRFSRTRVSMAEWKRQRDIYRSPARRSRISRGFSAFYLNRCNHSGIIMDGGPIGGIKQTGKWKLGARYNKANLRKRIEKIAEYGERINVSNLDGIEFITSVDATSVFLFIDPPYYHKGQTLYLNSLDDCYHVNLASILKQMSNNAWVLTYDDCPEIRKLYQSWANIHPFSLRYSASKRRGGREVMITPRWMVLPNAQESSAIVW